MIYDYVDTIHLNDRIDIFEKIFSNLHELFNTIEFDEFQRIIIKQIMDIAQCNRAFLFIIKEDTAELISKDTFDTSAKAMIMPINKNSIAGYCVLEEQIVNLKCIEDFNEICDCDYKFNPHYDRIYGFKTKTVLSVPIIFNGKIVGILQALNKKEGFFEKRDEVLMEKFAHLIAGTLVWRQQIEDLRTLEMLEREKAQFIRILVHELKSPVSAIVGLLDMVLSQGDKLSKEQITKYITRSRDRGENLIKTIKDLLVIHDLKEKVFSPDSKTVNIGDIVDKLTVDFHDSAKTKKISIDYKKEGNNFLVRGNTTTIPLIFSNLISNSVKYSPENSKIEIKIVGKKKYFYFRIRDYGIGIPKKEQKQLFKEFFRASNVKKKRMEGTGLGLVAVKQIVEMHHGKIFFKSRENEGTWFMIRLPLASEFAVIY
ncbi:MAG: GAF domain-containing sensor histidine kinase [Calditrichia bacterium]|nr:GAF domain-containing sensor histidine kinase [Calditrichia bacterium]